MFMVARDLARGAAAGTAATVVMSGVMFAAQRAGLLGRMPPRTITQKLLGRAGWRPRSSEASRAAATAAHFAFGAGSGALFGALPPPVTPLRGVVRGMFFGAAIWLTSYAGWIPALGLLPPPARDRPGRPPSMLLGLLAHRGLGWSAKTRHFRRA
jgi:hypothetical protein